MLSILVAEWLEPAKGKCEPCVFLALGFSRRDPVSKFELDGERIPASQV